MDRDEGGAISANSPEYDRFAEELLDLLEERITRRYAGVMTDDGKIILGRHTTVGRLPEARGGWRDHDHSGTPAQGQKLAEENTHEALDVNPATMKHWTREQMQDMVAAFIVDANGDPFDYDDGSNLLTIHSQQVEKFGVVFNTEGFVALHEDGTIVTKVNF